MPVRAKRLKVRAIDAASPYGTKRSGSYRMRHEFLSKGRSSQVSYINASLCDKEVWLPAL